jgi:mRNA interferase RelE/StbE
MASYHIEWKKSAISELRNLPKEIVPRVISVVGELSSNPFPDGVKKLSGAEQTYRIRIGPYRVVYTLPRRQRSSKSFAWRTEKTFTGDDAW